MFRLGLLLVVIGATGLAVLASSQGAQIGPALGHQPQVFVVNADGSALRQLTDGNGYRFTPTWSPDGRRLAYADKAITVITLATGKRRALARSRRFGEFSWIAWSPARDEFLVRHGAGTEDRPRSGIATISADGRRVRRLTSWATLRSPLNGPQWSPDGRRIAYQREGKPKSTGGPLGIVSGGNFDAAVISRTGRGDKRVRLRGDERQPLWSPDGKWLLVGRETGRPTAKNSKFGLWKMSPRGRRLQRVGPRIVNAHPSWSHDGARVAFTGHSDTGARDQALFVLDATPAGVPRLIAEHVGGSAWSPVENLIAFTDFDGQVRVTAPDGSGQRTLATFAPDTEFRYLSWSRDGRQLAFTAEKQRPSD
jgi:Tol biopolymer transport system component